MASEVRDIQFPAWEMVGRCAQQLKVNRLAESTS